MTSIGETLRRERLKRNLDLDQISRELKISSRLLEAIEEERFDKLPGGVFARSFVRQYARLLGLDEEEIAGEVQRRIDPEPKAPAGAEAGKTPENEIRVPPVDAWGTLNGRRFSRTSWLPALAGVVGVILSCSAVYAWWQHERRPGLPHDNTVSVGETVQAAPPPVAVAQPPAAAPGTAPTPSGAENPTDQAAAVPAPAKPDVAAPAEAPPVTPAQAAQPNPNAPVRVQVTAEQPVWVRVERDGKYLFSGTLDANQSRTLDANDRVRLRVGNAAGVSISLNGKPIGAVGKAGQPLTLQFTSGGFEIISAASAVVPIDPL